jgi:UDP-GlcNAc3NAcA epimerase
MSAIKIITVVGARPQFIKAASVSRAIAANNQAGGGPGIDELIVHTGQHYDDSMSRVFFDELHIPDPAVNLGVGSGSHGRQTGAMLERLETVFEEGKPDYVLVYGDTNSTLAGALAAAKLHIPVAHVESGLRSFNRRMPEEINRVVADHLASILFCPTETAVRNLAKEGITRGVHQVGDVMYDSVLFNMALAERSSDVLDRLGLPPKSYYLATVHRAENTDDPQRLQGILTAFRQFDRPVVLPLHPRTRKTLGEGLREVGGHVRIIDPVPYLDMLRLEKSARLILTDSGGVQKEAYWFGVPCVTLRDETEWVELVEAGCNRTTGTDPEAILGAVGDFERAGAALPPDRPTHLYGDGHSSERIVAVLLRTADHGGPMARDTGGGSPRRG